MKIFDLLDTGVCTPVTILQFFGPFSSQIAYDAFTAKVRVQLARVGPDTQAIIVGRCFRVPNEFTALPPTEFKGFIAIKRWLSR